MILLLMVNGLNLALDEGLGSKEAAGNILAGSRVLPCLVYVSSTYLLTNMWVPEVWIGFIP